MAFEVFEKSSAPVNTVPSITIQKRGLLSLNKAAVDLLKHDGDGPPDGVELLWDSERRIIGIRPALLTSPNAYPLRRQGQKATGPYLVAGTMFTRFIELDTTEARRWVPGFEGGMLTIDLNSESAKVAGRGRRRREDIEADTALEGDADGL